jgi:CRP-like cAMP-binding protein
MSKLEPSPKRASLHHLPLTRSADAEPRLGQRNFPQRAQSPRRNARASELSVAGEGYQKLRTKLITHGLPETVVDELIAHHTPVNYPKGSMIFLQGAPTDILYWVSSGLVDILLSRAGRKPGTDEPAGPRGYIRVPGIFRLQGKSGASISIPRAHSGPVGSDHAGSCAQSAQPARPAAARASP